MRVLITYYHLCNFSLLIFLVWPVEFFMRGLFSGKDLAHPLVQGRESKPGLFKSVYSKLAKEVLSQKKAKDPLPKKEAGLYL